MAKKTKQFKRSVFVSITLISALLFAVVSISYSWFLYQRPNKTDLFDINVVTSHNLQVSAPTVWGDDMSEEWHHTFGLKPVTGDGINFFFPVYETAEVVPGSGVYNEFPSQSNFEHIAESDLPNYLYRLDFTLLVEGFSELYLDYAQNKTYVNPASNRIGAFGFSPDNVCAAVRLAFIQNGEIKCIWIPNTTTELSINGDNRVLKDGTCESQYVFRHQNDGTETSAANSTVIATNNQPNGSYTDPQTGIVYIWGDITHENCPKISDLRPGRTDMQILVWLDGTDRECDISMSAGRIDANICFAATPITTQQ